MMTGNPTQELGQREFNRRLISFLESKEIVYAIGGSLAAMAYSEPRFTKDIDVMVNVSSTQLEFIVDTISGWHFYIDPIDTIYEFNLPSNLPINVIDGMSGVKADIYLAKKQGLDQSALNRRRRMAIYSSPKFEAWVLAPENIILYKLDYFRQSGGVSQKHPLDISKMLLVIGSSLDHEYLNYWAGETGVFSLWRALWDEFNKP